MILIVILSGNEPGSNGTDSATPELDHNELQVVSDTLVEGFQTGELESALGVTMTAVKISAPVPPSVANDTAWEDFLETAANDSDTSEVSELRKPTKLVVEWNKTRQQERATFPTKIIITFVDDAVCLHLCTCFSTPALSEFVASRLVSAVRL